MLRIEKSIEMVGLPCGGSRFSNFIISCPFAYGKLEKQLLQMLWDHTERLLARHSASKSEMLGLLSHVNVVNVEDYVLPHLPLSRNL